MKNVIEKISFWTSVAGFIISVYGIIEKQSTYIFLGLFFFVASVFLAIKLGNKKNH